MSLLQYPSVLLAVETESSIIIPTDNLSPRVKIIRASNNILASPVLETFRKIDQLEDDESLAASSNKALLYVPIIDIYQNLESCKAAILSAKSGTDTTTAKSSLQIALSILQQESFQPVKFKKIFNRYSDNIFYTDTNRANVYLAGGALPDSRQTQQYLLRNDILTGVENTKGDLQVLLEGNPLDEQNLLDALDDIQSCLISLNEYVKLSDPADVALAKKISASNSKK